MKKFSALIICFLLIITATLTGCAGFSINKVKYYNEVLATVGDTHITRYDLLSAYNSYGRNYYLTQQGQSESEALDSTLTLLIDREVLYQYALNDGKYKPTAYQTNEVVKAVFDMVDNNVKTYITTAKTQLNITSTTEEDESTNDDKTAYKLEDYLYKKRAKLQPTGEYSTTTTYYLDAEKTQISSEETAYFATKTTPIYKIVYNNPNKDPDVWTALINKEFLEDYTKGDIVAEIINKYFKHVKEELLEKEGENTNAIYNKVISLFATDLIDYEYYLRDNNGKPYDKDTNNLIYRFFKRSFETQLKSQYLTNLQEYYLAHENLSLTKLVDAYKELVQYNYDKYSDQTTYASDIKNIGTKGNDILYHPTMNDGTKHGYFIHTLLNFSDEQKAEITRIQNKYDTGEKDENGKAIYADGYENEYNLNLLNTEVKIRDAETGLETDETVRLYQILNGYYDKNDNYIEGYKDILAETDYDAKLNKFIEFMFRYTGDAQSTLVAGMPYVIGTFNKTAGETFSTNSAMEENFTLEAIKLMNSGLGKGAMTYVGNDNNTNDMCITSYGIHFLFYVNEVGAYDISYDNKNNVYISLENKDYDLNGNLNLYKKVINPLTGSDPEKAKTYFDLLFDKVYPASSSNDYTSNTNYSNYETNLVEVAKNTYKVTRYESKISATRASI